MPFDPSDDFALVVDGLEPLTFCPKGGSSGDEIEIASAARESLDRKALELMLSAGVEEDGIAWSFPATGSVDSEDPETHEITATPMPIDLQRDDTLTTSGGEVWLVVSAERNQMLGLWKALCRRAK